MFPCYNVPMLLLGYHLTMLPCFYSCHGTMLPFYQVIISPCYHFLTLPCCHVTMFPCYNVPMLQCSHVTIRMPFNHVIMFLQAAVVPCYHDTILPYEGYVTMQGSCCNATMLPVCPECYYCTMLTCSPCNNVTLSPSHHVAMCRGGSLNLAIATTFCYRALAKHSTKTGRAQFIGKIRVAN